VTARQAVATALAAVATGTFAADGCEAPGTRLESERYVVVYRTLPPQLAVGEHFAIDARVCAKGQGAPPTGLRVDATMPEHRHGMNYRATVAAKGGWQLLFDVEARGTSERLASELVLN
jgi:hypothetical protein